MSAPERVARGELVVTPEEIAAALLSGDWPQDDAPAVQVRPLRHGCAAVLIPRGMPAAQENRLRAVLGVPPRPAKRRSR